MSSLPYCCRQVIIKDDFPWASTSVLKAFCDIFQLQIYWYYRLFDCTRVDAVIVFGLGIGNLDDGEEEGRKA